MNNIYLSVFLLFFWSNPAFSEMTNSSESHEYKLQMEKNVGLLGGYKVKIPREYLKYSIEYFGESVWDKSYSRINGSESKNIKSFSLEVTWPDMKPVMHFDKETTITISPVSWPMLDKPRRGLVGRLDRLLKHPNIGGIPPIPKNVKYKLLEMNEELGLYAAIPVMIVDGSHAPGVDNIYWSQDENQKVLTLIKCFNNKYKKDLIEKCTHYHDWNEMKVVIDFYYEEKILKDWMLIEEKSKALIGSFKQ